MCSFLLVYRDYGYLKLHGVVLVVIGPTSLQSFHVPPTMSANVGA